MAKRSLNNQSSKVALFEQKEIRRVWKDDEEKWYFSVVDVVEVLTEQPDARRASNYWKVLKNRLKAEGAELVTKCNQLKMVAKDGKARLTDAGDAEQILRIVQSIPSKKAEPFKRWLAKVGAERIEEINNPELAMDRMKGIHKSQNLRELGRPVVTEENYLDLTKDDKLLEG